MSGVPLSGEDSAWLHMDRPTNRMVTASLMELSEPIHRDEVLGIVEKRLLPFERFGQRVVEPHRPGGVPHWSRDPAFDPRDHVVTAHLPPPGDEIALQRVLSEILSGPLDPSRPLWQIHVFERFGRGSLIFSRIHHAIADGFALLQVMLSLCDAPQGTRIDAPVPPHRRLLDEALGAIRHPTHLVDVARSAGRHGKSLMRLLTLPPDPDTPLRGELGVAKRVAWSEPLALDEVKAIGHATGTTVNDVLVSCIAGALRRYFAAHGARTDADVHAMMPVNLRTAAEAVKLGNYFGMIVPALAVSATDPLERLAETKRRMDELKQSPEAFVGLGILQAMGHSPLGIENLGVEFFARKASVVLTNVPGPRTRLSFAGREITRSMFWVPQSGELALGVSVFSYAGAVIVGVKSDAMRIPDPDTLVAELHAEFAALRARTSGH